MLARTTTSASAETTATARPGQIRLVGEKLILEMLGISHATWWRWVAANDDLRPIKVGPHTTRWRLEQIEAYVARRAANSNR